MYWVTEATSTSVSDVGSAEGEAGVRDTWKATATAIRLGDGKTICALMTPNLRKGLEDRASGTCAQSVGELFSSSDSSTLNKADSTRLEKVVVKGKWAEVVEAAPKSAEPSYSYMERFGDRWRWSQRFLYAGFHPDKCPEIDQYNWYDEYNNGDPKCYQDSVFPSAASGQ
ncbi:hypothetical protein ABT301_29585 [Streptomyces sp. NPDC000987]|uniref:hypothetical protein n=1 Tax=Streptomyces sp. NPDC000987 TaxID=3154374 RepID=UPI0033187E2E